MERAVASISESFTTLNRNMLKLSSTNVNLCAFNDSLRRQLTALEVHNSCYFFPLRPPSPAAAPMPRAEPVANLHGSVSSVPASSLHNNEEMMQGVVGRVLQQVQLNRPATRSSMRASRQSFSRAGASHDRDKEREKKFSVFRGVDPSRIPQKYKSNPLEMERLEVILRFIRLQSTVCVYLYIAQPW
jgi:hypothetical protein